MTDKPTVRKSDEIEALIVSHGPNGECGNPDLCLVLTEFRLAVRGEAENHGDEVHERKRYPRHHLFTAIDKELDRAYAKHGAERWGRHEFYAILKEEVDEMWDAIKGDAPLMDVALEAIQVAAMCIRYLETGDRYQGAIFR